LIQNKKKYFQNANFANRVDFDLSMIPENGKNSIDEIKNRLFKESEKYAKNNDGRCWVLIEFIFKNSAAAFYEKIEKEASLKGYEIKMLSGTILEPVRKSIINDLKERTENNEESKIILVSQEGLTEMHPKMDVKFFCLIIMMNIVFMVLITGTKCKSRN